MPRLGLGFGLDKHRVLGVALADLIACGLTTLNTASINGIMYDKIGYETRPSISAKYILGDGALTANIGLASVALTYLDVDTLLDVVGSTDASGLFTFPLNIKVANIKIGTSIYHLQEGTGDTIADSVNGNVAKLSSNATFVETLTVQSQADKVGYTLSNGITYYWDELTTDLIPLNVIIPNISDYISTTFVVLWALTNRIWNDSYNWVDAEVWID